MDTDPLSEIDAIIDAEEDRRSEREQRETARIDAQQAWEAKFGTWAFEFAIPVFQPFVERFRLKGWDSDAAASKSNSAQFAQGTQPDAVEFHATSPAQARLNIRFARAAKADHVEVSTPISAATTLPIADVDAAYIQNLVIESSKARFGAS